MTRAALIWFDVYDEIEKLHLEKSGEYGTPEDALSNYREAAEAVGEPPEYVCWLRIIEKGHRALNMIRAGRGDEVKEGPDVSNCAIIAESFRRERARV